MTQVLAQIWNKKNPQACGTATIWQYLEKLRIQPTYPWELRPEKHLQCIHRGYER